MTRQGRYQSVRKALVERYAEYKKKRLLEQVARVVVAMLLVYSFWNAVRQLPSLHTGELSSGTLLIAGSAAVLGIAAAVTVLLLATVRTLWVLFPAGAAAFAATSDGPVPVQFLLIVVIGAVTQLLIHLIVAAANRIHRW